MRIVLGLDYGEKRVGIAVSDALGIAAHGLPTLKRTTLEADLAHIERLVAERKVKEVIVGLPRNMDGSVGPQARKVQAFADRLRELLAVPVRLEDERLTTERAERTMVDAGMSRARRRTRVDRLAAQFILQQYLNRRPRASGEEE